MPVMNNLSYVNYALVAAVGAAMVIGGRFDLGGIGSFLQYTRNLSQPISSISQQFNSILNALAGAERIFNLIDEPLEVDNGQTSLVNAVEDADGQLSETDHHTGIWAWKRPLEDGGYQYVRLRGDVPL